MRRTTRRPTALDAEARNGLLKSAQLLVQSDVARTYLDLAHAQRAFEGWRALYNHERPHDALGLNTPASRYRVSPRTYPSSLPVVQYLPGDVVRTVSWNGLVRLNGHRLRVSNALLKLPIAFRADPAHDGCFDVYFCHHRFMHVDLRALSEQP